MPDDVGLLLLIAGIAFLGSLVYGITGFGSSLVTIPLATHFVPLPFALAVFALMDLANALRLGLAHPGDAIKSELVRMVPHERRFSVEDNVEAVNGCPTFALAMAHAIHFRYLPMLRRLQCAVFTCSIC